LVAMPKPMIPTPIVIRLSSSQRVKFLLQLKPYALAVIA
jgi:hypothetical protein